MAELKLCPFCGKQVEIVYIGGGWFWRHKIEPPHPTCPITWSSKYSSYEEAAKQWNTRAKERDDGEQKVTCLNCKHLMFSDMYGECNKQLRIVSPSDTCEYAEPKERGN